MPAICYQTIRTLSITTLYLAQADSFYNDQEAKMALLTTAATEEGDLLAALVTIFIVTATTIYCIYHCCKINAVDVTKGSEEPGRTVVSTTQKDFTALLAESIKQMDIERTVLLLKDLTKQTEEDHMIAVSISAGDFKKVSIELRKDDTLATRCLMQIHDETFDMTGLEYSVFVGNGKMALLFFLCGADPLHNAFNGEMETVQSHFDGITDVMTPFTRGETIPGFRGLRALLQPGDENAHITRKYSWLMERCCGNWDGWRGIREEYLATAAVFEEIGASSDWKRESACVFRKHSLCFKRAAIELPIGVVYLVFEFSGVLASCIEPSFRSFVRECISLDER
uniref:Uncharacterized protein n=1 Tax=Proboscia inermis TaxID=420281 RepID=A0A7S0G9H8_9STRA|mmetsp:Transcript_15126/g.15320  ORF Transcript_15126/g.15320 Transcript_15126/m.15320 type:complete len:340 (+) Transcript_15126:262-1281(+)